MIIKCFVDTDQKFTFFFLRFHSIANIQKKIGLTLEVSADLPEQSVIDR